MDNKRVIIYGGGTVSHIANHLALCAPAYGTTAKSLAKLANQRFPNMEVHLRLTKMAGGFILETNQDISDSLDQDIEDDRVKIIIMNTAICDFEPEFSFGKYGTRLKSSDGQFVVTLTPTEKLINKIRQKRKDIFLVAFKTTCGATEDEQYIAALNLCKKASCNLVFANDTKTRLNLIATPEEARYHVTADRDKALAGLMEMIYLRSHLTFTRSTVVDGKPIPWTSPEVPSSLRMIVNYCIQNNAYKPFNGATAGHFAVKLNDNTFLTSIRKTDFNDLPTNGLVKIVTDGPDTVLAYGAKPSVGGQSQRIVFNDHKGYDCIVHFHCPKKPDSLVPTVSQYEFECGSHECGQNTSNGLRQFGNLKAVYLDEHGPNIIFNRNIDPLEVIAFINDNFDLDRKTGGFVSIQKRLKTPNTLEIANAIL